MIVLLVYVCSGADTHNCTAKLFAAVSDQAARHCFDRSVA